MWICNKCETYNEDHEQFCCICNAKKSEAGTAQPAAQGIPGQQSPRRRAPEITPSERISATVVTPPKPRTPAPSPLIKGGKDDLLESFGMSSVSKKITTGLVALNAALLILNILGRFLMT